MIRYALRCDQSHAFESWFPDSISFDRQSEAGHVTCPICGSGKVTKALMAPAVQTRRGGVPATRTVRPEPQDELAVPVALADEPSIKLRAMLRAFREHVVANSTDVGPGFADEARKIHDGAADERPIHGQASPDDVRSLLEDGIEILPLPVFPDDRN